MTPEKITAVYEQESDSCQDYGTQELTIETDDAGAGKFIRFHTNDHGWSLDSIDEINEIFNDILKRARVQGNSFNRNSVDWKNS